MQSEPRSPKELSMLHEQIEFKTLENAKEHEFCPLTSKKCNEHCMWNIRTDVIDEDGIDSYYECAILYLVGELLVLEGAHEEGDY